MLRNKKLITALNSGPSSHSFVTLLLATMILLLSFADGFCDAPYTRVDGNPLWADSDLPIKYVIDSSAFSSDKVAAIRRAFNTWGAITDSGLRFLEVGYTGQTLTTTPCSDINPVVLVTSKMGYELPLVSGTQPACTNPNLYRDRLDGNAAVTTPVVDNGRIINASIIFDSLQIWTTDESNWLFRWGWSLDIESVALHEIGHLIGLAHPRNDPKPAAASIEGTIMGNILLGKVETLYDTDKTAAIDLYPPKQSVGDDRFEPNDTLASATFIQVPFSDITLKSYNDDWYKVWVQQDEYLQSAIYFTNASGDLDLYLYDSAGNLLTSSADTTDYETLNFGPSSTTDFYYLKVHGYSGATNAYSMSVRTYTSNSADLRSRSHAWNSNVVTEGDSVWFSAYIYNAGLTSASASHARLFLSTNGSFDNTGDWNIGDISVPSLLPMTGTWVKWYYYMPNIGTGSYSVWGKVLVDSWGEVAEGYENNLFLVTSPNFTAYDSIALTGLSINGPNMVIENGVISYTATAWWSNGTFTTVTPTWSENSPYATISNGVLSTYEVTGNQTATITASYSYGGATKTASLIVTIADITATLSGLTIYGPSSVDEGTSATYIAVANWSDGSTSIINPIWSEDSSYSTISSSGVFTADSISSNHTSTITASLTYRGVTRTANRTVTIACTDPYTLTVTKAGTGSGTVSVNVSSLNWNGNTGTGTYIYNTTVTLTATAAAESTVVWSGNCSSTGGTNTTATCTISNMTTAKTVTATFHHFGWQSIPGAIVSPPALAWNPVSNKIQMVVRGSNDTIWTATFNSNGTFNGDWTQIPGAIVSPPALAWNPVSNKLQMVVRGSSDTIWTATFNSNGTFNGDWTQIPGAIISPPALAWNPVSNKLQMVVRGSNDTIWTATFNSNGTFNGDWTQIPGAIISPPALVWNSLSSEAQLVVQGSGNSIWTATFNSSGTFNNDWAHITGVIISPPALAWNPVSNDIQMLVRGSGDTIWTATFNSTGAFNGDWSQIPGAIIDPPAIVWNSVKGNLLIVVRGTNNTIWAMEY